MWPARYFPDRYFPGRYWVHGADALLVDGLWSVQTCETAPGTVWTATTCDDALPVSWTVTTCSGISVVSSDDDDSVFENLACPYEDAVTFAAASTWYWEEAGHTATEADGFYIPILSLIVARPSNTSTGISGPGVSHNYSAASINDGASSDLPDTLTFSIEHRTVSGTLQCNKWSYIFFERIDYWTTHALTIDWVNFSEDLFDAALAGGLEIWCAEGPGTVDTTERTTDGESVQFRDHDPRVEYAAAPTGLPALGELLYTISTVSDLPISIPVPAGRAFWFRTVNQDPTTVALSTWIQHDVTIGFLDPDPACAYKQVRSDDPTASGNIVTGTAISAMRLRGLARQVAYGGTLTYTRDVLIYRDPDQLAGNTLRINVTAPFLWYIEDPAGTNTGGVMTATLTAYAVDESELTGTSAENWAIVKGWTYTAIQARLGAALTTTNYTTSDESTFSAGAGNVDVDISSDRRLVYYSLTAASKAGSPTVGLRLPSLTHNNPSLV